MTSTPSARSVTIGVAACLLIVTAGQAQPCSQHAPPAVTDLPDAAFADTNGDGIDGMRCGPIFVDLLTGADTNPGTIGLPKQTISAAIAAARTFTPVRAVYVSKGTYVEVVTLLPGVDVFGGYDAAAGWSRSAANATTITGAPIGVYATDLATTVTLGLLTVDSSAVSGGAAFNAALVARNAQLSIVDCRLRAGAAGSGAPGAGGTPANPGSQGGTGEAGVCSASCSSDRKFGGGGGSGGFGPGGATGGFSGLSGGNGGLSGTQDTSCPFGLDAQTGFSGNSGGGGTSGGGGGGLCGTGGTGNSGATGTPGNNGAAGQPFVAAQPGTGGQGGRGGGGGGGGGGCDSGTDCSGSGGGGGGGGGAGGNGGMPGQPGGSSLSILAQGGNVTVNSSELQTSAPGPGGAGGNGGSGGFGGNRGNPGSTGGGDAGGFGGLGGTGGPGGPGGGGAGGNSIGLLAETGAVFALNATSTILAPGGAGGVGSGGNSGQVGLSTASFTRASGSTAVASHAPTAVSAFILTAINLPSAQVSPVAADPDSGEVFTFALGVGPSPDGTPGLSGNMITFTPNFGFSGWTSFPITATSSGQTVAGHAIVCVLDNAGVDCNQNHIPDAVDIASGTSEDCDGNGIPDDCVPPNSVSIVCQPLAATLDEGLQISLSIGLSNPAGATYSWRKNTAPLVNDGRITGAQSQILNIFPIVTGDEGTYDCIATTPCQTLFSFTAPVVIYCRGDFNRSGVISVQDIFDFLAAYFAGCP